MASDEAVPAHTGLSFVSTIRHDTYPTIDPTKADLFGKVVLITGASKGIGKAIAIAYAQAGVAGLALLARSQSGLEGTQAACFKVKRPERDLRILPIVVDVTNTDDVANALTEVEQEFGRLDIVINNAALMDTPTSLVDSDPDTWWDIWAVNIKGVYNITRSSIPFLIRSGGLKTIVNLTTVAALYLMPNYSAYQPSKLAALRLTELICVEYGDQGILSYAIHPGGVPTDMAAQVPRDEHWSRIFIDTPELPADVIVYYTKERQEWLAGRYISAQWDVEELIAKKQEIIDGDKLKMRMVV